MPFFPDELMPLTPKEDAPGTIPPANPIGAADYNRHDEELRAIQEFLLEKDEGALRERVLALANTANSILRGGASRTLSGYALSGTRPRFSNTKFSFLKGALGQSDTTVVVDSTDGFPDEGLLTVLNDVNPEGVAENIGLVTPEGLTTVEWIRYSGKTSDSFLNCERGYLDTSVGTHAGIHQPPNESQPNCPTTPLNTIRPVCQPPLLIPTYVFPFFGFTGEQEEIEARIVDEGVRTYFPTDTDFEAFSQDAMGSLGPPDAPAKNDSDAVEVVATNPNWIETWIPDWSNHNPLSSDAKFEFVAWDEANPPVGTLSELATFVANNTPRFYATGSAAFTNGVVDCARSLGLWRDTAGGGLIRRALRVRRRRSRARRTRGGHHRYTWVNAALTAPQASSLISCLLTVADSETAVLKPLPEWTLSQATFRSEDTDARLSQKLTPIEVLDIFLDSVRAGLVQFFSPNEQVNLNKPGVPVFAGKVNVSHGLASWSGKRKGVDSPRIVQYADGTLFCFLGENDDFRDVGQSVIAYATWLVNSGI